MNAPGAINTSFSTKLPGLQLAVDSTSLGEFKTCPRRYQLGIIEAHQPKAESPDLTFGIALHKGVECYHEDRAAGHGHENALRYALDWLLKATWNKALGKPWFSGHPEKNRLTLVRTLVWYLDHYRDDSLETIVLASGVPAVELSFQFDSGITTNTGEHWTLCGHLDRLATMNGVPYVVDIKTTKHQLGPGFFEQFSPHNQFSMYALAGQVAFGVPTAGIIVCGVQVGVNFSRFERALVQRSREQLDEWLDATHWWLRQMERCAEDGLWPQNEQSCGLYGGCRYRRICARSPASRQTWLDSEFKLRMWDPLARRTDI